MEVQERFIILKKMKYAEADLIIHALSVNGEKISLIARGALKSKKRFNGGVLEPTHFVQLNFKQSHEEGKLHTLNEAHLLNDFKKIRRDYDHLEFALHVLETVSRVSQEGDKNSQALFNLLGNTLKAIEDNEHLAVLKMHFYLKFLYQQGVLTADPWMAPFLRAPLTNSVELAKEPALRKEAELHLSQIEVATQHYIRNAEAN